MKENNVCSYCLKPIFRFKMKERTSKWYHSHSHSRMCDTRKAHPKLSNCPFCDKVLNSDGTHPSSMDFMACLDLQHQIHLDKEDLPIDSS